MVNRYETLKMCYRNYPSEISNGLCVLQRPFSLCKYEYIHYDDVFGIFVSSAVFVRTFFGDFVFVII